MSVQAQSCLPRSLIQRLNGSVGSVMSEPSISRSSAPSLPETWADGATRWHNAVLTQVHVIKKRIKNKQKGIKLVREKRLTPPMDPHLISMFMGIFPLIEQEVSVKNQKISTLELEKDALLEQLDDLQVHGAPVHTCNVCRHVS